MLGRENRERGDGRAVGDQADQWLPMLVWQGDALGLIEGAIGLRSTSLNRYSLLLLARVVAA